MPISLRERALKARLANWKDGRADVRPAAMALMPKISVETDADRLTEEEVVQFTITGCLKAVEHAGAKVRPEDKRQAMLFDLGLPETLTVRRGDKTESVDMPEAVADDMLSFIGECRRQIGNDTAKVEVVEGVWARVAPLMLKDRKLRLADALLLLG